MPGPGYRIRRGFKHAFEALFRGRFNRIYGRFAVSRHLVALGRRALDRFQHAPQAASSLLPALPLEQAIETLRADGIWCGLWLPQECVREIAAFARRAPCRLPHDNGERFLFEMLREGRTPAGSPAPLAEIACLRGCAAIARLAADAQLLEAARRHLGFRPRRIVPRLYWSPVLQLDGASRHKGGQPVDFHFDIEAATSLYVFFYIEGGCRHSGAHVAIAGSHRDKPMRLALAPAFQSERRLFHHYPRSRERVIEGEPGFGFFEDPGCYHKVLAPTRAHRLVLQLRLS